nr:wiskott-Aldrich syndrome protein homolog 1-like [Aegilops tauschii subsp. strangulata]
MAAPPRPVSPARTRAHCRACLWPPSPPGRSRASSLRRARPPLAATGRRFPCPAPVPPAPPRMRRTGRVPRALAFAAPDSGRSWPLAPPSPCSGALRWPPAPGRVRPCRPRPQRPFGLCPTPDPLWPWATAKRAPPQNVYKKGK